MSHFYGTVRGQAQTEATRRGNAKGGLRVIAASWNGAITVRLYVDKDGDDAFIINEITWGGQGRERRIAQGKIGKDVLVEEEA